MICLIFGALIQRGWFNCCWCEGAEVDSDWSNGHSENSEEAEESRKSGYNISWTCQGREERIKERGEKGRKKGREKGCNIGSVWLITTNGE